MAMVVRSWISVVSFLLISAVFCAMNMLWFARTVYAAPPLIWDCSARVSAGCGTVPAFGCSAAPPSLCGICSWNACGPDPSMTTKCIGGVKYATCSSTYRACFNGFVNTTCGCSLWCVCTPLYCNTAACALGKSFPATCP